MTAVPVYLRAVPEIDDGTLGAMEHIDQLGQRTVPVGEERIAMQLLARNIPNQAEHRSRMLDNAQTVGQAIGSIVPEAPIDSALVWEAIVTHDCIELPREGDGSAALHLATRLAEHAVGHYIRSTTTMLPQDVSRVAAEYYSDSDTPFGLGIQLTDVQQVAHDIAVTADEMATQGYADNDQTDSETYVAHMAGRFSHPVYRGRSADIVAELTGERVDILPTEPNDHYLTVGVRAIIGCVGHELNRPPGGDHSVMFTVQPAHRPMVDSRQIGMVATIISRQTS